MQRVTTFCCLALIGATAMFGCADPTKDKPKAVVGEATEDTADSAGGSVYAIAGLKSKVDFVGSKVTGSHDGGFKAIGGEITVVDGSPEASTVEIKIHTTTLWSDNEKLTKHLKSADFFDVEKYPEANFKSTKIVKTDSGYDVTGNLDLHGVTKSITFPATIKMAAENVTAKAEFSIKRFDFDIVYPGRAEDLIRDDVLVRFDLVAVPKTTPKPATLMQRKSERPMEKKDG